MARVRPTAPLPQAIRLSSLLWLFAGGLAVRWTHLYLLRSDFWLITPLLDDNLFQTFSGAIIKEGWLARSLGIFDLNPAYAYFLALVHALGLKSILSVFALQHAAGALVPVLLVLLTERIMDRKTAWIAGFLGVFYGPAIFYEARYLGEFWIYFFNVGMLTCLAVASETKRPLLGWAAAGLCLGLSAIFRPNVLAFVPFLMAWGLWDLRGQGKILAGCLAVFLAGVWAPMFPFQLRNHLVAPSFGWGLSTASGGVNLYLGNNAEANGVNQAPSFVRYGPGHEYLDFKAEAERRLGKALTRPEVSSYWIRQTERWFCDHPGPAARLLAYKAGCFWNFHEPADNFFQSMFERFSHLWKFPLIGWSLIAPLGLAGLIWGLLRPPGKIFWLLTTYTLFYFAINVAFCILSRYRFPVVAGLIPLAAWVIALFHDQLRRRHLGKATALLVLVGAAFAFSHLPIIGDEVPEVSHYSMGVIYANQGQKERAVEEYRASIQANPLFQASYLNLGILEVGRRNIPEAIAALESAHRLETDPARKENIRRAVEELKRNFRAPPHM